MTNNFHDDPAYEAVANAVGVMAEARRPKAPSSMAAKEPVTVFSAIRRSTAEINALIGLALLTHTLADALAGSTPAPAFTPAQPCDGAVAGSHEVADRLVEVKRELDVQLSRIAGVLEIDPDSVAGPAS